MLPIFKAYDIRGVYPVGINREIDCKIGRAFAVWSKAKRVILGRDARLSSPALFDALAEGIMCQGADVVDIGIVTTPMLYFASRKGPALMVTASHNPKQYNGVKLVLKGARALSDRTGINAIGKLVEKGHFPAAKKRGRISKASVLPGYIKHVLSFARQIKPLRVVVDAGNGVGGIAATHYFARLPGRMIPLFFRPDGRFPNRNPNPMKEEHLASLRRKVVSSGVDLGVAFDGDADRVVFLDEHGKMVRPDFVTALVAQQLLKQHRGAKILCDVRSSKAVLEAIRAAGGKPLVGKVGHAFIKARMRKEKILFAGELTGHYYYQKNQYADNADITVMLLLSLLSKTGLPLSELVKPLQKYRQSGELNYHVKDKRKAMILAARAFKGKISRIDGITVECKDWWFNLRPSNTEPLVRLNVEAATAELVEDKVGRIVALLRRA
ncbi:phosphomannomutase/phosphoglucomutase [Candidatus Woesearchaeota archaeon]|nr:phosphomannomutase/phosphoglucomutase [Candidatus Woesearchaeota archaeon]